ncbi:hypothetical protein DL765_004094 [Monosporascus sp. GIB2]|nr:hypothetical protein DL765_004094 [Monosporascus sp. GIB2]
MAAAKVTFKPYPVKPPTFRSKTLKIEAPEYNDSLNNAYQTTRDVATELRTELQKYLESARKRVCDLIRKVNTLNEELRVTKEELRVAREEIKAAKEALVTSNSKNLHPALMLLLEEPGEWCKDEIKGW